jgi:RNA recognition motif-containing protein
LNTGKVIVGYQQDESANQAVTQFNNRAVDGLICSVKPFFDKKLEGEEKFRVNPGLLARRLYLKNVPYDATIAELEKFVGEFVEVEQAVVPRDKAGLARGYAFVYLEKAEDLDKAVEYVDGRHIRSR